MITDVLTGYVFGMLSTPFQPSRRESLKMIAASAALPAAMAAGAEASEVFPESPKPNPIVIRDVEDFGILILQRNGKPIWGPESKSVIHDDFGGLKVEFEGYDVGKTTDFIGCQLIDTRRRVKYPEQFFSSSACMCCGDTLHLSYSISG